MSFNAIRKSKILMKFKVLSSSGKNIEVGDETEEEDQVGINI